MLKLSHGPPASPQAWLSLPWLGWLLWPLAGKGRGESQRSSHQVKLHHQAQRGAQHGTWLCLPPSTELRGPHSADDFREHLHGRESSHSPDWHSGTHQHWGIFSLCLVPKTISLLRNRYLKIFCLGEPRANRDALLACEDAARPLPAPYLCSGAFCHQKADNNSTITTHHHSGVGWGRKAEQRDHWNGEQEEKQLGGVMS